jgi:DNA-binding FrmR family transcriptional regulator
LLGTKKTMESEKDYSAIIDQIEMVRTRNNKNWMDILRLAFKHAPKDAAEVLSEIYKEDKSLNDLAQQLIE